MAEPLITAWMTSPASTASAKRLSTRTQTPLPNIVPPAEASKARVRPSLETMPPSCQVVPARMGTARETPPARAASHS
jgi:hypothetical protein